MYQISPRLNRLKSVYRVRARLQLHLDLHAAHTVGVAARERSRLQCTSRALQLQRTSFSVRSPEPTVYPSTPYTRPTPRLACASETMLNATPCSIALPGAMASGPSAFEAAMHGSGVIVMAVDSRVVNNRKHKTLASLLRATRWSMSGPARWLSASHLSVRVPNVFCAQPIQKTRNCGAFDLLLLFRASIAMWSKACSVTLSDSCAQPFCERKTFRPTAHQHAIPSVRPCSSATARSLCQDRTPGRCRVQPTEEGVRDLEATMLSFQRTCGNGSSGFSRSRTCRISGLIGMLFNEWQFREAVVPAFEAGLIAVGSIRVAGVSNGTLRRCRAQRLSADLRSRFGLSTEVWEYTIQPSVGHGRKVPPQFFSTGARHPQVSDFAGSVVPLASYWGFYNEDHWRPWSRVR